MSGSIPQEWPVFILGCHRTGTTLLRRLLDAHPHLACPPESKFLGGLDAFLAYPQTAAALGHLGVSDKHLARLLRHFIDGVMGEYARARGKRRWLDKTPNYWRHTDLIRFIYEDAVGFIIATRHPLDTIASMVESPYFHPDCVEDPEIAGVHTIFGHTAFGYAHYWRAVMTALLDLHHRHHSMVVRYEDVVNAPLPAVNRILSFIGEDAAPQLAPFASPLAHGYGDWKITSTDTVLVSQVGRFLKWPAEEIRTLWRVVEDVAANFGYQPDSGIPR